MGSCWIWVLSRIWLQFWKLRWTLLRSLGTGTEKFFFHKWPYKYTNIIHMYVMCHRFWKFSLGWIVCSSTMIQLWANDFRNRIRHQSAGCSYVRANTLFWEVNMFEHVRVDRKGEGSNLVSRCGPKYQCDWRQPRMHTIRIWLNCALSTSCGPVKKQPESQQVLTSPISHSIKVGKLWGKRCWRRTMKPSAFWWTCCVRRTFLFLLSPVVLA